MGESKRRQKLDPSFNKGELSVQVRIEKNPSNTKWLCVAYILGVRTVISAHFNRVDAVSASKQVGASFNRFSVSQWRDYTVRGNRKTLSQAIATLNYPDDDEITGLATIDQEGNISINEEIEVRKLATMLVNQAAEKAGRPKVFIDPIT